MARAPSDRPPWLLLLALVLLGVQSGCARLAPYRTPLGIEVWQDQSPPRLSLAEKGAAYQERLERFHQLPDGLIRYRFDGLTEKAPEDHGNQADGSFFLGIYLASQALRYAVTGEPAAREQVRLALRGAHLYAEVSGRRGLLARYFSPTPPADDPGWRPSPTHPVYSWRSDVSKDQYAGFVHGLGVALAVLPEPGVRAEIAEIAAALADHLIEHDLLLIDWNGERTTHGDLRGRIFGAPIGVNALIALAIAKTAAVATGEARYVAFYERLVAEAYPQIAYWAHVSVFGIGKRVNDNMAYLALYPLLLLESDEEIASTLRRGARRTWRHVRDDRNAFFAFVHAAVVGNSDDELAPGESPSQEGRSKGRASLLEFPDRKVGLPVDLTRGGFAFPRACLKTSNGLPRSRRAIPLYLRPRGSSLWASDPYRLAGRLRQRNPTEFSGIDYLIAYWIGRHHGFLTAEE